MQTPVLLIIFNRFDTTKQVLASLRLSGVKDLFIYSDGPRVEKTGEINLLKLVQAETLNEINWPCNVITNFKEQNEGPRLAIGHAVTWFFEHVEEGIILEHDCVPAPSFYPFCETLLAHYRNDTRIMHISGDNFQFGKWRGDGSYYFSRITHIWGWATWKRAWKYYDVEMRNYPSFRESKRIEDLFFHKRSLIFWKDIFDRTFYKKIDSWDYQWSFAAMKENGLSILPNVNLISNVGFDEHALNTTNPNDRLGNMKTGEIVEIKHPTFVIHDQFADSDSLDNVFFPTKFSYAFQKLISWWHNKK
jgi:hypothetical protein